MEFLILFIQVSFHRQLKRSRLEHARNVGRKVYHTRSLMATNNSGTTSLHNAEARGRKNPNQQQRKTMREALSSREWRMWLEGEALAVSLMELCSGDFWSAGCSARSRHLSNIFTSPCDAKLNCFREVFLSLPTRHKWKRQTKEKRIRDLISTLRDVSRWCCQCYEKGQKCGMEMFLLFAFFVLSVGKSQTELKGNPIRH